MSFHVLGYVSSISAGSGYREVAALDDGVFRRQDGRYIYGREFMIFSAFAASTTLSAARFSTPSLRAVAAPQIRPITLGTTPGSDPNLALMLENPVVIPETEELSAEVDHGGGGAEDVSVLLWGTRGLLPAPKGTMYTVRGTGTTSSTSDAWTTITLSWDTQLPRGRYAVVGAEYFGSNGVAHRWIFDDQSFRPGGLACASVGQRSAGIFYDGRLGLWGTFNAPALPQLQVLSTDTASSHTAFLQVIPLG